MLSCRFDTVTPSSSRDAYYYLVMSRTVRFPLDLQDLHFTAKWKKKYWMIYKHIQNMIEIILLKGYATTSYAPFSSPLFLSLSLSLSRLSLSLTTSLAQWLRRPPRERKIPGSNPACAGILSGSSHISDLKIGTPVATLPGAWRDRVSAGTGRPGVSIL